MRCIIGGQGLERCNRACKLLSNCPQSDGIVIQVRRCILPVQFDHIRSGTLIIATKYSIDTFSYIRYHKARLLE